MALRPVNTRGFRAPRLRLRSTRSGESVALDRDEQIADIPYVPWPEFLLSWRWNVGEAVTLVGPAGSGKTTLARHILPFRQYVVVMATKARDPDLYERLQRQGFVVKSSWSPEPDTEPKVIFKPSLPSPDRAGREAQKEAFREALVTVFEMGRWTLYMDEVRYLADSLGLKTELETLWLQGRALDITMVAGTQRPVSIPIVAFDATHLFFWRTTDKRDVYTASEYTGIVAPTVQYAVPRLPRHEILYVNTRTDELVRTRTDLTR